MPGSVPNGTTTALGDSSLPHQMQLLGAEGGRMAIKPVDYVSLGAPVVSHSRRQIVKRLVISDGECRQKLCFRLADAVHEAAGNRIWPGSQN